MKDEIKEILRILKSKSEKYEYCLNANISFSDESYEAYLLLDYITTLQQENERKDRLITQYGEGMCAYANRIDKAIEYIKEQCSYEEETDMCCDDLFCGDVDDLLDILQNGSEENERRNKTNII